MDCKKQLNSEISAHRSQNFSLPYWARLQTELFSFLDDVLGSLTPAHRALVAILDMVQIEILVRHWSGLPGRTQAELAALARVFLLRQLLIWRLRGCWLSDCVQTRYYDAHAAGRDVIRYRIKQHPHAPLPSFRKASCRKRSTRRLLS